MSEILRGTGATQNDNSQENYVQKNTFLYPPHFDIDLMRESIHRRCWDSNTRPASLCDLDPAADQTGIDRADACSTHIHA